jgi:WD40 repeat protein
LNGEVRLYDLRTYKLIHSLSNGLPNSRVAWSPDGTRLAVGGSKDYGKPFFTGGDSTNSSKAHIAIYDTSTWKTVFEPAFGDEMVNQFIWDLAWSPEGKSLAFSSDVGGVQVIDAQTGALISRQGSFAGTVTDISWSADGTRLLADNDLAYGIRRWRLSDDEWVRLFDQRAGNAMAVAWSPDGTRIASGHSGGGVCFWSAATNQCLGYLRAHQSATFSLAWSPDGQRLLTGGGVLRTWDTTTGALLRSFGEVQGAYYPQVEWPAAGGPLFSLEASFEQPGQTLLRAWDAQTGALKAELRGIEPQE